MQKTDTSVRCDHFPRGTRAWTICNGLSELSIRQANNVRASIGLDPLPDPDTVTGTVVMAVREVQVIPVLHKPTTTVRTGCKSCGGGGSKTMSPRVISRKSKTSPGSRLLSIFEGAGFESCPACIALASKMDRWGSAECQVRIEEIVDDILPRALAWEQEKAGWFARLIPDTVTRSTIHVLVNRAIVQSNSVITIDKWAYGVTTISERAESHLPTTLSSLRAAGFPAPRLFIDDEGDFDKFGLEYTVRRPRIRTFGNWVLGLSELLIRNPDANKFAMFQDDFVTCKNLREYLDQTEWPAMGYLNLYTFPSNQSLLTSDARAGWYEAGEIKSGGVLGNQQTGYGAVGLAFTREAVVTLLEQQTMVVKPLQEKDSWRRVDGVVALAMNQAGWREFVHNPSLIQHTGLSSSMGNRKHPLATSFPGEDFDALTLLKPERIPQVTVVIPHRDTPELLEAVLPLWLAQSEDCDVWIVDTGSTCDLSRFVSDRVKIHYLAQGKNRHPSEPIAAACQYAQDNCKSEFLFQTHADVFPKSPHLLRHWKSLCSAEQPVVGYEMSPRDHVNGELRNLWRGRVGHSLTMCHLPTLNQHKVDWSYAGAQKLGLIIGEPTDWDTEVTLGLSLAAAGIVPLIVGHDRNYERLEDGWHVHCRSYPSAKMYHLAHYRKSAEWVKTEIMLTKTRLVEWKKV